MNTTPWAILIFLSKAPAPLVLIPVSSGPGFG
jgi:hypothetical protein